MLRILLLFIIIMAALAYVNEPKYLGSSKQIKTCYHYIRDGVMNLNLFLRVA